MLDLESIEEFKFIFEGIPNGEIAALFFDVMKILSVKSMFIEE